MFAPEPMPEGMSVEDMRVYLERTLLQIASVLNPLQIQRYDVQYNVPDKAGDIDFGYFAAGSVGVDEGYYYFANGVWNQLVPPSPIVRPVNAAYLYSTGNVQQAFTNSPTWDTVNAINAKGVEVISTADVITRRITIGETRTYIVMGAASISTDKNNAAFTLGISVNGGTPSISSSMYGTGRQTGDQINMRGGAPVNFTQGDTLQLKIQNNDNQAHTVNIRNATLWVAAI